MNVVLVVLDTVRKDRLSPYNSDIEFTQNLQSFSEEAKVFQNAVSQAPWTLPSHASMFTGLYPWEHDATQKQLYLETDRQLLAEKFEEQGYTTGCFTSNTWISPYTGMAKGFQQIDNFFGILPSNFLPGGLEKIWRWLNKGKSEVLMNKLIQIGEKAHWMNESSGSQSKTPKVIEKAENFIEDNREDDFFLFLNLMDAHLPYFPPEEYRQKHAPEVEPSEICQEAHNHNGGLEKADFEALSRLYNAEIDFLDDQLGELFDILGENNLEEDTVLVVVSDHGENLGENGLLGHQFSVSEQLVSVPMMIKAPGLDRQEVGEQVELRQLYGVIPKLADLEPGKPDFGSEYALGGYERPRMDLKNIPEAKREELDRKLSFVRKQGKKLIRSENDEISEDRMINIETGEKIEIDQEFVRQLNQIGEAEEGRTDVDEEQVKQRLEELGYM